MLISTRKIPFLSPSGVVPFTQITPGIQYSPHMIRDDLNKVRSWKSLLKVIKTPNDHCFLRLGLLLPGIIQGAKNPLRREAQ